MQISLFLYCIMRNAQTDSQRGMGEGSPFSNVKNASKYTLFWKNMFHVGSLNTPDYTINNTYLELAISDYKPHGV